MSWWPWRQHHRRHGPRGSAGAPRRSREVWADLVFPADRVGMQAAEPAQRRLDRALLEPLLNEPTVLVECAVRVAPFVLACRPNPRWEVRHG
jgi:hypothetical protein